MTARTNGAGALHQAIDDSRLGWNRLRAGPHRRVDDSEVESPEHDDHDVLVSRVRRGKWSIYAWRFVENLKSVCSSPAFKKAGLPE